MSKGLIIIIEDDHDDKDVLVEVIGQLGFKNKIIWFDTCDAAYKFLSDSMESIFIIFSDINLPKRTGLELKHDLEQDPVLKRKSIPFIFYSTCADGGHVDDAYSNLHVHGFFKKENNYDDMKRNVKTILDYWTISRKPEM